ncbi:hypothetical protein CGRA01v4_11603 [Colletotrichum graminicola]|nr:hypothetical protein CGRA01v4_11603 [Colletotrichum graminicola]
MDKAHLHAASFRHRRHRFATTDGNGLLLLCREKRAGYLMPPPSFSILMR